MSGLRFPVAAAALYVAGIAAFFQFTADDAFIVVRYADSLVERHEWTFNPGERINALTSPLHGLLVAALRALSDNPLWLNKLLSVACVPLAVRWVARRVPEGSPRHWFIALTLLSPLVALWTAGGMETPWLLVSVCALAAVVPAGGVFASARAAVAAAQIGGLCVLTRYDAVVFVGPLMVVLLVRNTWPVRLALLSAPALPLLWLGFASMYYGDVFPTALYVKAAAQLETLQGHTPLGIAIRIAARNAVYVLQFLVVSGIAMVLASPLRAWLTSARARSAAVELVRSESWLYLGLAGVFVYGLWMATVHMMFGFRLLVPYLPVVALAAAMVWRVRDQRAAAGRRSSVVLAGCLLWQALVGGWVYYRALNPTADSIVARAWRYEYSRESLRDYAGSFMPALDRNAGDIRAHWLTRPEREARPARVLTYAGGRLPVRLQAAYVYESLVSYRHGCRPELAESADYLHVLSPRHGSPADQLGRLLPGLERVSSVELWFDGQRERSEVYFNPRPRDHVLPPRIDGPCAG